MSIEKKSNTLSDWLTHPSFDDYMGRRVVFKLTVLARLASGSGESYSAIAKRFGVSRAAAAHHVKAARKSFGFA